jgi:hypothetical protein
MRMIAPSYARLASRLLRQSEPPVPPAPPHVREQAITAIEAAIAWHQRRRLLRAVVLVAAFTVLLLGLLAEGLPHWR